MIPLHSIMDARLGGLGAIEVDWEETQAEWIEEPLDYNQPLIGLVQDEIDAIENGHIVGETGNHVNGTRVSEDGNHAPECAHVTVSGKLAMIISRPV